MAIGIFGALGTAQAASFSEGQNKRTPQLEGMDKGWVDTTFGLELEPRSTGQASNKNKYGYGTKPRVYNCISMAAKELLA